MTTADHTCWDHLQVDADTVACARCESRWPLDWALKAFANHMRTLHGPRSADELADLMVALPDSVLALLDRLEAKTDDE